MHNGHQPPHFSFSKSAGQIIRSVSPYLDFIRHNFRTARHRPVHISRPQAQQPRRISVRLKVRITAKMKEKGENGNNNNASAKRKRHVVIDLSDDEDTPDAPSSVREPTKRPRTREKAATPPPEPVREAAPEVATTPSLPTPQPTPQKPRSLYDIPEIAERYATKISIEEGVEYTNPYVFSLKPRYWRKWKPKNYIQFAEHLRQHFEPISFAQESSRPVEEIKHVFAALVLNPLYFCEEAKKRGEEGMKDIFELYGKFGTPSRPWGKKKKNKDGKILPVQKGELSGVGVGSVQVILEYGSKKGLKLVDLSDADKKYLEDTLTDEDMKTLWTTSAEVKR